MNFLTAASVRLGPFSLSTPLLFIFAGIAGGSVILILVTADNKIVRDFSSDIISGFFLLLILSWKVLPIILSPKDFISNPLMILYATGGIPGIVLGITTGFAYLGYKIFFYNRFLNYTGKGKPEHNIERKDLIKPVILFFAVMGLITFSLFTASMVLKKNYETNGELPSMGMGVNTGNRAPEFELTDINGNIVNINNYNDKWIILNFWATWCPPCKAELPGLIRFYEDSKKSEMVLLGINASETEKSGTSETLKGHLESFVRDRGINFPVLMDNEGVVSRLYGIESLPTTIVISPDGVITKIKRGAVDPFWLESSLKKQ